MCNIAPDASAILQTDMIGTTCKFAHMGVQQEAVRDLVREMLRATGLKPTQLARRAGVVPSTLTRFLNGDVKHILSLSSLYKLSEVSGIAVPAAVSHEHAGMPERFDEQAFNKGVGRRLMWVREIARHTQAQAAEMIGAKEGEYSKWESGELAAAPARLLRFCARYRVSMDYIYRATMQGVHPELADMLLDAHPELQRSTTDRVLDMDTLRRAYMAAIGSLPAP